MTGTLAEAACAVLGAADPAEKVGSPKHSRAAWRKGALAPGGEERPPARPARPELPELRPPRDMKRRRAAGSREGRIALLHALAHIELNAIDLAWDMVARFGGGAMPRGVP